MHAVCSCNLEVSNPRNTFGVTFDRLAARDSAIRIAFPSFPSLTARFERSTSVFTALSAKQLRSAYSDMKYSLLICFFWAYPELRSRATEYEDSVKYRMFVSVETMSELRPTSMEFDVALHIRQSTRYDKESCLEFAENLTAINLLTSPDQGGVVSLPNKLVRDLKWWRPDIYIVEAKNVKQPSDVIETTSTQIDLTEDECFIIELSKRAVVVGCEVNFKSFPFDEHICRLTFRTFLHDNSVVECEQTKHFIDPRIQLHEFELNVTSETNDNLHDWADPKRVFSASVLEFRLRRTFTNQFLTAFLPATLIVCVTMASLLMDISASSERITLCSTALLAQYTHMTVVRADLPAISYLTTCDTYMLTCFVICLIVTVESSIVEGMNTLEKRKMLGYCKETSDATAARDVLRDGILRNAVGKLAGNRFLRTRDNLDVPKNRKFGDKNPFSRRDGEYDDEVAHSTRLDEALKRDRSRAGSRLLPNAAYIARLRQNRFRRKADQSKTKDSMAFITPWSDSPTTPNSPGPQRAWWQEERPGACLIGEIFSLQEEKIRVQQLYKLRYQCFRGRTARRVDVLFKIILLLVTGISGLVFWLRVVRMKKSDEYIYISEGQDMLNV